MPSWKSETSFCFFQAEDGMRDVAVTGVQTCALPICNVCALIADDQPFLVEADVRHLAEPIVLLAHADREALLEARVEIEYERGTPVFDPEQSTIVLKSLGIDKGDLERGFASADLIVDGTYRTGHQEHVYIEPNGVVALPEDGGVAILGSIQ